MAVLPSAAVPFTLGNGSFSTDEVGPLMVKYFWWQAKAWTPNDTFLTLKCLIDCGAHLNCIRNDLIATLGLKIHHLANPLPVTLAFDGGATAKPHFLDTYVEFSLSILNSSWSSRPCKAVVVKNLCADFILGLPFLSHNQLVIDCSENKVIHKEMGIDLLDANAAVPRNCKKQWTLPKVAQQIIQRSRQLMLEELKIVCAACW